MDRFTIPADALPFGIRLIQNGLDRFNVVYGMQCRDNLTYAEAARELGECIMHALACDGAIDNRTQAEARADGDKRPYFNGGPVKLQAAA